LRVGEGFFGISFDEGFEECGLSYAWWSNDCDESWRGLFWDSVDLGDMEALLFDLEESVSLVGQGQSAHIMGSCS